MSRFVDTTLDVSAVPAKPAGAGKYVLELARRLIADEDVRVTIIARRDDGQRWDDMPGYARIEAVTPTGRPQRLLWEQFRMPSLLESLSPQVHHGPHYTLPERADVTKVATIHDMTFFDHPEWHERAKVPVFRRAIKKAVKHADALIAVSHDTARRLQERFGGLNVHAIPLGVDHHRFFVGHDERERRHLQQVGVEGRYVAFVGTLEPRKNIPALLQAFDRVARRDADIQLVLAGKPGWGVDAIDAAMSKMHHADRVVRLGYVDEALVPALFRHAAAVAYPSLIEGFGLPALEALACGAPLVTSKGSAMEEVVDDAALLVDPHDIEGLARSLARLLEDERLSQHLRWRGPQVAARYTWEATAEAHKTLYLSLAHRQR